MEVSLNHQFNMFFQLLPTSVINSIFSNIVTSFQQDGKLTYQSIESIKKLNINDATQPDIFFDGNESLVGIELKLDTKSSIDQVMKYALLFYFSQLSSGVNKKSHLILVGCKDITDFFKEKFRNINELQQSINTEALPDITKKGNINLLEHKENITDIAKKMTITFISYQCLYDLFIRESIKINDSSPYSETIKKLFDGINNELLYRGLAKQKEADFNNEA